MINFNKNNLSLSNSPYLNQHSENPVFWQEWSLEVLAYAKQTDKVLFISSGYSTCHWCHVMAGEAFSNQSIADFLNSNFVSIKIDREQRPDIDQFLMDILLSVSGSGGWPLNVFLSPDLKPVTALTYAGIEPRYNMPAFLTILKNVLNYYNQNKLKLEDAKSLSYKPSVLKEKDISGIFYENFDSDFGGFGRNQKFHPHCSMLFMLHYYEENKDKLIEEIIKTTLGTISLSGLHDHLQGGFYRYCVDQEWKIPHFEKMLYDQAMLLWCYSAAYKLFKNENYKKTAEKIFTCLIETFEKNGLYYSAHDADTEHIEGETYIWSFSELNQILNKQEFKIFTDTYYISENGNFENKNHLIKKENISNSELEDIEKKLLTIRKNKKQPFTDKKFITSWNAILGVAFVNSYRCLHDEKYLEKAILIYKNLKNGHFIDNRLIHTSINGKFNSCEFLEDYASLLLLLTYLHEETGEYSDDLKLFYTLIEKFRKDGSWLESENDDFRQVKANYFDHPQPSSISLAEMAILRANILLDMNYLEPQNFKQLINFDYLNLSIFIKNGFFHIFESPEKLDWKDLPLNSFQKKGINLSDCYKGVCIKI